MTVTSRKEIVKNMKEKRSALQRKRHSKKAEVIEEGDRNRVKQEKIIIKLSGLSQVNSAANSLLDQYLSNGDLTEKQWQLGNSI